MRARLITGLAVGFLVAAPHAHASMTPRPAGERIVASAPGAGVITPETAPAREPFAAIPEPPPVPDIEQLLAVPAPAPVAAPPPAPAVEPPPVLRPALVAPVTVEERVAEALRARLGQPAPQQPADRAAVELLQAFYAERAFAPAFTTAAGWAPGARAALARFATAERDGLDPRDYRRDAISDTMPADPDRRAAAELDFARAFLVYARHAGAGRVDPRRFAPFVQQSARTVDLAGILRAAAMVDAAEAEAFVEALHPRHPGFLALRAELRRALAEPDPDMRDARNLPIPGGPVLRAGMSDPRIPALRQRFAVAEPAGTRSDVMDQSLVDAVRSFQAAEGISPTGTVGPATLRALNRGVEAPGPDRAARIAQIVVNLERWRWLPQDLGRLHVVANTPDFGIRIVQDGRTTFSTRGVMGRNETPTPVFSDEMTYFVVNPSWTVPPGIARREMFPLLATNRAALARRGIEVVRASNGATMFRQPPGPRNALGRIKFMFPNQHSIYMHDTPSRYLFQRARRDFSNGCVRVENPMAFAEALFVQERNMTAARIEGMVGDAERYVRLRNRIPVHLTYFTVVAGPDGGPTRHDDVYGLDQRMRSVMGL